MTGVEINTKKDKINNNLNNEIISIKNLIEKKKDVIAAELSNACGRPMKFNVTLKEAKSQENTAPVEIPLQVNILVNAFKGTIVAGRM